MDDAGHAAVRISVDGFHTTGLGASRAALWTANGHHYDQVLVPHAFWLRIALCDLEGQLAEMERERERERARGTGREREREVNLKTHTCPTVTPWTHFISHPSPNQPGAHNPQATPAQ